MKSMKIVINRLNHQDDDAKDIARKRGIYNKSTVVYASATPSVDLYYNFEMNNPNNLLKLTYRFNNKLPMINIVHTEEKRRCYR